MSDELITVLRQIRDELREMNGKDAEGNRKPPVGLWMKPIPAPYPYQPYTPYWNTVTSRDPRTGYGWLVNDHQGENPLQSEDG